MKILQDMKIQLNAIRAVIRIIESDEFIALYLKEKDTSIIDSYIKKFDIDKIKLWVKSKLDYSRMTLDSLQILAYKKGFRNISRKTKSELIGMLENDCDQFSSVAQGNATIMFGS